MDVSAQIIEVLDFLGEKFGIAFDWTSDNILPYVEQLCGKIVKWELCTSIAWIVIAVVLTTATIIGAFVIDEESFWIVAVIVFFIGTLVICVQIFDIVACNTFPEKVILNYIKMHTNLLD